MHLGTSFYYHAAILLSRKPPLIMRRNLGDGSCHVNFFYMDDLLETVLNADEAFQ